MERRIKVSNICESCLDCHVFNCVGVHDYVSTINTIQYTMKFRELETKRLCGNLLTDGVRGALRMSFVTFLWQYQAKKLSLNPQFCLTETQKVLFFELSS